MTQPKGCEGCSQAHDCKRIYERLGNVEGPSVALKALVAFGLPLGVFAAMLGFFGRLLQPLVARQYQTLYALAMAVCATTAFVLVASRISRGLDKRRC